MIKGLGQATIYVDGKEIGEVENVEIETNDKYDYKQFDFELLSLEPVNVQYEGELIMTRGTIETPKEDDRISSNVLSRYFKGIALDRRVYRKISKSLDRLERVTK